MNWNEYQEAVAAFFITIGADAQTDATVTGVRGSHRVDVLVTLKHFGVDVIWVIECKLWKTSVPKEKILTLQQIVQDIGADRGFLMSESGFQAGAIKSAATSNISLSSLAELQEMAGDAVLKLKLKSASAKLEELTHRYHKFIPWDSFNKIKPVSLTRDYLPNLFMIRMEIFKVHNDNFPIRLLSKMIHNTTDFILECERIFKECETEIVRIEAKYNTNHKAGQIVSQQFRNLIDKLIVLAFEIVGQSSNAVKQDQIRIKAVAIMKKIGAASIKLRAYTINTSLPYLTAINKVLIDGLYLDLMNLELLEDKVQLTSDSLIDALSAFDKVFQPISSPPAPKMPS